MLVDICADTVTQLLDLLDEKIPAGKELSSARIFCDVKTANAVAATAENAFLRAERQDPGGEYRCTDRRITKGPERIVKTIEADSQADAEKILYRSIYNMSDYGKIQNVRVLRPARHGIFGRIGKKTGAYEFDVLMDCCYVEVRYEEPLRIVASLGKPSSSLLNTRYVCRDTMQAASSYIAHYLHKNHPRQVLILGPGAHKSILAEFYTGIPEEYNTHLNQICSLAWLGQAMKLLRDQPDNYHLVVSNFPIYFENTVRADYYVNDMGPMRSVYLNSRNDLLPYGTAQTEIDLAVFWTGMSPLSYLDAIKCLFFENRTGKISFHNVMAIETENIELVDRQYELIRSDHSTTAYQLLPRFSKEKDRAGVRWFGGILM